MQIIPDWRILIVQGAGFLLLLLVFARYLFKPIGDILEARRKEIDDRYDDAETQRNSAAELKSDYEHRLAEIEEETRAKIAEAVKEGQAMREEILAESRDRADSILSKAQDEINRERERAVAELKETVATLAVDAAGKIIEENLDESKHRQLVNKFIDDLDGVSG